jgi:HSP20 family protein
MAKEHAKDADQQGRKSENEQQRNVARRDNETAMRPAAMPPASPITFMRRFMEDLDRLFDGFGFGPRLAGGGGGGSAVAAWIPPVEVEDRDGQLVIRAEIPGLTKDQIQVEFQDGQLVISGERRQEHEERREGFYRSERSYGRFYRTIPLPEGVDPENATATYTNGVLEVRLPAPQRSQAKRIDVQETAGAKQSQRAA